MKETTSSIIGVLDLCHPLFLKTFLNGSFQCPQRQTVRRLPNLLVALKALAFRCFCSDDGEFGSKFGELSGSEVSRIREFRTSRAQTVLLVGIAAASNAEEFKSSAHISNFELRRAQVF